MFRTSGHHENRGLYKKNLKNWRFEKKCAVTIATKIFQNLIFANFFKTNAIFMMPTCSKHEKWNLHVG